MHAAFPICDQISQLKKWILHSDSECPSSGFITLKVNICFDVWWEAVVWPTATLILGSRYRIWTPSAILHQLHLQAKAESVCVKCKSWPGMKAPTHILIYILVKSYLPSMTRWSQLSVTDMKEANLNSSGPVPGTTLFSAAKEQSSSMRMGMMMNVQKGINIKRLYLTRPNGKNAWLRRIDDGTELLDTKGSSQIRHSKCPSLQGGRSQFSYVKP